MLREATEPLVLQALRQGLSIELDAPDAPVVARAHPIWLGKVVNNLLDNAQRCGGPHIVLKVSPLAAGGAEITVEDNSLGVRADELTRLFEPFWRGERADMRSDGGSAWAWPSRPRSSTGWGAPLTAETRPEV